MKLLRTVALTFIIALVEKQTYYSKIYIFLV